MAPGQGNRPGSAIPQEQEGDRSQADRGYQAGYSKERGMSDIIDMANDRADQNLALSLKAARAPISTLPATGHCHNCDEELDGEALRFCDTDCRNDWQKRNPGK
jgi:hypothetical protein